MNPENAEPRSDSGAQVEARKAAMAVLARAAEEELEAVWSVWPDPPAVSRIRGPETGLVMVRGRIGGGGSPFNLGEATVTRATVRLDTGWTGHAAALGTSRKRAELAAVFDALWQDKTQRAAVETSLIEPVKRRLDTEAVQMREETAATRVDFFTMVRGED